MPIAHKLFTRDFFSALTESLSISPRQVIVHGTSDASNHLMEFSKSSLGLPGDKVFAPQIGEHVDATTERHIYQVKENRMLLVM